MISTFGYANTFAVYLGITISLAISRFLKVESKRKKILYTIYIFISAITLLLTQSKAVLAIIAVIILIFIIKGIKDKKINKKWIIAGVITALIFVIYVCIAKEIGKPLVITQEEKNCVIRGVEKNTKYKYEFEIEAKTEKEYDTFQIKVVEVTRYFSEITLAQTSFSNFSGIKTMNFETTNDADHIEIRIKNNLDQELTINKLLINGKQYILEYKIILEPIVRVFTTFNFKNSSVWQRGDYWNDSIKIIKSRWITGTGGNTWRVIYGQVQDYLYYAKECHSYILEIWMSFGIVGITSYIFIIAISIQNGIKKKNEILEILVGISILVLHSLMDFDMSFLIMEMIFFMFIAIINQDDKIQKEDKKTIKIVEILIMLMMLIISMGNILGLMASIEKKSNIAPWIDTYQYSKIINNPQKEEIKKYIKNEPYQNQNTMYRLINETDLNEADIEFLIKTWKDSPNQRPYEIENTRKRGEIMLEIAQKCTSKKQRNEIIEIIKKEYIQNSSIILNYVKNKETAFISGYEFEYYTDNYKKAIELEKN